MKAVTILALLLVEQWGGDGPYAHPNTMTVSEDGSRVSFKLSALPAGAKVRRARLVCFRDPPAADTDEALVDIDIRVAGAGKPLPLAGPWYDAFAVPPPAVRGGQTLTFEARAFPGWIREKTFLEIAYAARSPRPAALPAVKAVRAVHSTGQTFITWREVQQVLGNDRPTWGQLKEAREKLDAKQAVRYRIYTADAPITAATLAEAELLGEVKPLSGYNVNGRSPDQAFCIMRKRMLEDLDYAKTVSSRHYGIPPSAHDAVVIDRFVIPGSRKPLANGTGMYVHSPAKAGNHYYAVTLVVNGRENTAALAPGRNVVGPVAEKPGPGLPVLQRKMDMEALFDYAGRRVQYVQWTAPPLSNLPNRYYNWSVFIPDGLKPPAPLELVLTGNDMFRRPRWPHRLDTILVSPHDAPFSTLYYGYPESRGTLRSLKQGTIQPYTWRRMLALLEWASEEFKIDRARVTCSGDRGLSATAALHFAMRQPEVFSVVYTCKGMPNPAALPLVRTRYGRRYRTETAALQRLFGKIEWGLKTDGGQNVWEFFDLAKEVAAHPEAIRPMLSYGGRGGADWGPIGAFLKALADARQPVISEGTWGAVTPPRVKNPGRGCAGLNVRRDRPIPVFTAHSGDYQGGRNGGGGQTNYGVWWLDAGIVDTPERFEIDIVGGGSVSVTPRRMKKFVIQPGEKVRYEVKPQGRRHGRPIPPMSGQAVADKLGLVTAEKIPVPSKLTITRSGS